MKILDKYIIKKFLTTFILIVAILTSIAVVIDLSQKLALIQENGSTVVAALINFYPYWCLWLVNMFMPIAVFISVIYFTSRITDNTEVVAITTSGVSFFRFTLPYVIVAGAIMIFSLTVNHFLLPMANVKKNEYKYKYLLLGDSKETYYKNQAITAQISPSEYLFISNYNRENLNGSGFLYQKFNKLNLTEETRASDIVWNKEDSVFILKNYFNRKILATGKDELSFGNDLKLKIKINPDELLPKGYSAEIMKTPKLIKFMERERFKGSASINSYKNEMYQRSSVPFSTFVLTILALSLSSTKRRGGIGVNLAIGISIAFLYIFFGETSKVFSEKGILEPIVATWLSNFVFGLITLTLYIKRAFS